MAVYGFRGLGLLTCTLGVVLVGYMTTVNGAAERAKLRAVENGIVQARKEIRDLETEYNTRANVAQLEQWNAQGLGLAAPASQQFADETQLAHLDAIGGTAPQPQMASLTVPAGAKPAVAAQPAAATAATVTAPPAIEHAVATAQRDHVAGIGKPRVQRVAMLDDRLLSASTMSDLQARAAAEQLKLR
jgi:hypothetical protein